MADIDIRIEAHGLTLIGFSAESEAGQQWLDFHLDHAEPFGNRRIVETRFAGDIVDGMRADGLAVEGN